MQLPVIAICGRPNVGKSTLFNVLAKRKVAIVDPTSGVTRDRISTVVEIEGKYCELIDTGGVGLVDEQNLEPYVLHQVKAALQKATIILFMVDVKEGIMPLDQTVADMLREYQEKVVLIANKTDYPALEMEKDKFRKLGFSEPVCVSALERTGINDLRDILREKMEDFPDQGYKSVAMKIAVVGKPNAGKSTLINYLAQEDRMIVSELPGTTRDSVDVYFEKDGMMFIAIDTAGMKRKKNVNTNVEFYSQHRAQRSIRRADVVLFLLDATSDISRVDKELANYIIEEHKPVIICINKWDLAKQTSPEAYERYISKMLPGLYYAPISFITAKTGKKVFSTLDLARSIYKQAVQKISTGELNRVIRKLVEQEARPSHGTKQAKIFYTTQTSVLPPTFLFFVNDPTLFSDYYRRYLAAGIRESLGFPEIPIKMQFKKRKRRDLDELGEPREKEDEEEMEVSEPEKKKAA